MPNWQVDAWNIIFWEMLICKEYALLPHWRLCIQFIFAVLVPVWCRHSNRTQAPDVCWNNSYNQHFIELCGLPEKNYTWKQILGMWRHTWGTKWSSRSLNPGKCDKEVMWDSFSSCAGNCAADRIQCDIITCFKKIQLCCEGHAMLKEH